MTQIEVIRFVDGSGSTVELQWDPDTWYVIGDDHPHLDIRTRGHKAHPQGDGKLSRLEETSEEGTQWQRWNFEADMARERRLGEMSLRLKVPKEAVLRCYVVPTALLNYREVVAMVEEIEAELGTPAAWDLLSDRPDRSWSRRTGGLLAKAPSEIIRLVEEEERAAKWIRRDPFVEPGPASRDGASLPENALVSHWAARRTSHLLDMLQSVETTRKAVQAQARRYNPERRQERLDKELAGLEYLMGRLLELRSTTARMVREEELGTTVYPSPLFQRDHRLRLLLKVFAPASAEALSESESVRSHYPPVFINHLWEIWGAVWLINALRRIGFSGFCTVDGPEALRACSWRMTKGDITIELDYEPEPVFVDYGRLPPIHERDEPALEWAARNQAIDLAKPFIGLDIHCSPDYVLRIATKAKRALLVGDACLASPEHHGKKQVLDAKPYTVEGYRRTIGWSSEEGVVRCHPLGGFAIFPSPSEAWAYLESLPGAADCTLLCPSPLNDTVALERLKTLLNAIVPNLWAATD